MRLGHELPQVLFHLQYSATDRCGNGGASALAQSDRQRVDHASARRDANHESGDQERQRHHQAGSRKTRGTLNSTFSTAVSTISTVTS